MDLDFNEIWEISNEDPSVWRLDISSSYNSQILISEEQQIAQLFKNYLPKVDCQDGIFHSQFNSIEKQESPQVNNSYSQSQEQPLRASPSVFSKKVKKCTKPSPYHNFQKHLTIAIKNILNFSILEDNPSTFILAAQQLWSAFLKNTSSTKKNLHFVFNQFNEYGIRPKDLINSGFEEVYASFSKQILADARLYLANLALKQLNQENISSYLQKRRIKNPQKFKRYIMMFRQELQDGFLKKRFTNRSRKQQLKKQFAKNNT